MVDAEVFMNIMLGVLGSILLISLIVLSVKLINIAGKVDKMLDDVNGKIAKFDNLFNVIDLVTDNMALISDKIVDAISNLIKKVFVKKDERKEEYINEE